MFQVLQLFYLSPLYPSISPSSISLLIYISVYLSIYLSIYRSTWQFRFSLSTLENYLIFWILSKNLFDQTNTSNVVNEDFYRREAFKYGLFPSVSLWNFQISSFALYSLRVVVSQRWPFSLFFMKYNTVEPSLWSTKNTRLREFFITHLSWEELDLARGYFTGWFFLVLITACHIHGEWVWMGCRSWCERPRSRRQYLTIYNNNITETCYKKISILLNSVFSLSLSLSFSFRLSLSLLSVLSVLRA